MEQHTLDPVFAKSGEVDGYAPVIERSDPPKQGHTNPKGKTKHPDCDHGHPLQEYILSVLATTITFFAHLPALL